jgi:hypothetical protein
LHFEGNQKHDLIQLIIRELSILIKHLKKEKMKKNLGIIDKVIRILIAVLIAVLFFMHVITGTLGIALLAVAAVLAVTVLLSFCPLYFLLGIKTGKSSV